MYWVTLKRLVMGLGLIAAGLLVTALVSQYGFDLYPCDLCLYQRYPYALAALMGAVAYWVSNPRYLKVMAIAVLGLFAIDAGIAFYHSGVELGWFPGPSGCSNATGGEQTLEEMRRAIMQAPLVTCDQAMIHVLGLSMAAWNAIAAVTVTIAGVFLLIKINQKPSVSGDEAA
jgi:disulfide bond formation protein DsbB